MQNSSFELLLPTEQQPPAHILIQKPRVKRPQVKLPFGLKAPKRKRPPRAKSKAEGDGGRSVCTSSQNSKAPSPQHSRSSSTTSSSSGSGSTSDSDSSDSESDESEVTSDSSRPDHLNLRSYIELRPSSSQIVQEASNVLQEEEAASSQGIARVSEGPVVADKTFFNSHVGVLDFKEGQYKSRGRVAICYHCSKVIERSDCRFVYSYNIKRPWKYIHDFCFVAFVRQRESDSALVDAIAFLSDFQCNTDKASQLREVAATLLQQLSVKSSSSSSREQS